MDKSTQIVSVVIVTFNAGKFLQNCLNSIYAQSCKAIDIIVIDGRSTDGTAAILAQNPGITYWESKPDKGIYDAMNKALPHVKTPWIYFLGADDLLLPDFSLLLKELVNPTTIYYGNVLYKGKKCSGPISAYRQAKLGIFHQSIIYPTLVFKKYQYNTKYRIAADYALNMQLHKDPAFTFQHLDYTIADYNDTGVSAIAKDHPFEADKSNIILSNFGFKIWIRYIFRKFKALFTPKEG